MTPETDLVSYVEDGRVVFEARKHLMRRIQHTAAATRTDDVSVADELISERRAAATRERTEAEG